MLKLRVLVLVLGLGVIAACGDSGNIETVTVEREVVREATPDPTEEPTPDEAEVTPEQDTAEDTGGGDIRVPNVEGKDHQLAQDTMQAAGLYNLAEEDATGQDRLMLIDRNWTVVEQKPRAGERVNADTTIILRSKKDGE